MECLATVSEHLHFCLAKLSHIWLLEINIVRKLLGYDKQNDIKLLKVEKKVAKGLQNQ